MQKFVRVLDKYVISPHKFLPTISFIAISLGGLILSYTTTSALRNF